MASFIVHHADVAYNINRFCSFVHVPVIGVVKGNGYGLGLIPFSRALREGGITMLAVDDLCEAAALRDDGFDGPLLLLKPVCSLADARQAVAWQLQPFIGNMHTATMLAQAAEEAGCRCAAHLYIDTGFGGYGFADDQVVGLLGQLAKLPLDFVGTCTHFAASFGPEAKVRRQYQRFETVLATLRAAGFDPGLVHCCNSHAALRFPEMHAGAVRVGSVFAGRVGHGYTPAGLLHTRLLATYPLRKGTPVGYAQAARMPANGLLGVVDCGYAQGLGVTKRQDCFRLVDRLRTVKQALVAKPLYGLINDQPARVLGRVNMNHTAVLCPPDAQPGCECTFSVQPLYIPENVERIWLQDTVAAPKADESCKG